MVATCWAQVIWPLRPLGLVRAISRFMAIAILPAFDQSHSPLMRRRSLTSLMQQATTLLLVCVILDLVKLLSGRTRPDITSPPKSRSFKSVGMDRHRTRLHSLMQLHRASQFRFKNKACRMTPLKIPFNRPLTGLDSPIVRDSHDHPHDAAIPRCEGQASRHAAPFSHGGLLRPLRNRRPDGAQGARADLDEP